MLGVGYYFHAVGVREHGIGDYVIWMAFQSKVKNDCLIRVLGLKRILGGHKAASETALAGICSWS